MADAMHDDNGFPTLVGISCVDGVTPVRIARNPSNGGLKVDFATVISVTPAYTTQADSNGVPVMKGVSTSDPSTILPVYVNPSNGAVLVEA
jgi:hypothetical protein